MNAPLGLGAPVRGIQSGPQMTPITPLGKENKIKIDME